jgi:hypothetical protein
MKFCVRLLSLAAVICLSLQARADLVGDTINSSLYNGASTSDIEAALGSTTVPGSIDNFGFTTTITGNTITVAEDGGSTICNTFNAGDICGVVLTDATEDPGYTAITLDGASTTNKLTASFSGNKVYLDFTNLTLNSGDVAIFDLTFGPNVAATPEPGSLMLLGTGALGLVGTLRRRIFTR